MYKLYFIFPKPNTILGKPKQCEVCVAGCDPEVNSWMSSVNSHFADSLKKKRRKTLSISSGVSDGSGNNGRNHNNSGSVSDGSGNNGRNHNNSENDHNNFNNNSNSYNSSSSGDVPRLAVSHKLIFPHKVATLVVTVVCAFEEISVFVRPFFLSLQLHTCHSTVTLRHISTAAAVVTVAVVVEIVVVVVEIVAVVVITVVAVVEIVAVVVVETVAVVTVSITHTAVAAGQIYKHVSFLFLLKFVGET